MIGYKLHMDIARGQIPISCVLTSASVPRQTPNQNSRLTAR
jgi:hypothetical protein